MASVYAAPQFLLELPDLASGFPGDLTKVPLLSFTPFRLHLPTYCQPSDSFCDSDQQSLIRLATSSGSIQFARLLILANSAASNLQMVQASITSIILDSVILFGSCSLPSKSNLLFYLDFFLTNILTQICLS
ncbi:unnamed protein product [Protopolystoma xenopodis]|uniref:Uncharacterized protein n=1 Tax=Protopolystoma xenopodis TaxID=117903 RepID=A0A3S5A083_9PLAT|nr:unnamed protein product [Protopolystoma xenopodis]